MGLENILLLFWSFAVFTLAHANPENCDLELSSASDRYRNFEELRGSALDGQDFRVVQLNRGHLITILAPHGGWIEPGTSQLARELAGSEFNLYLFEGIKAQNNFELHLTSTYFDEPRAVFLMQRSLWGVSIHGFKVGCS